MNPDKQDEDFYSTTCLSVQQLDNPSSGNMPDLLELDSDDDDVETSPPANTLALSTTFSYSTPPKNNEQLPSIVDENPLNSIITISNDAVPVVEDEVLRGNLQESAPSEKEVDAQESLNCLPEICLIEVLSFLSLKDRFKVQRVCKLWLNLVKCTIKKLHVSFQIPSEVDGIIYTNQTFRDVLTYCGKYIETMKLGNPYFEGHVAERGFGIEIFRIIHNLCPNLKHLDICGIHLTNKTSIFLKEFSKIESFVYGPGEKDIHNNLNGYFKNNLYLKKIGFYRRAIVLPDISLPKNIVSLCFHNECTVFLWQLKPILNMCKSIKNLYIANRGFTCNASALLAILSNYNIENLQLFDNMLSKEPSTYYFTSHQNHLTKLCLTGINFVNNQMCLNVQMYCQNLVSFCLADSNLIDDNGFDLISDLKLLQNLSLRNLANVTLCKNITDKLNHICNIKCMSLNIHDRALTDIMSSNNLKSLVILNCIDIDQINIIENAIRIKSQQNNVNTLYLKINIDPAYDIPLHLPNLRITRLY